MNMSLLNAAAVLSLVIFSSPAHAESGLILSEKKTSCERLQSYAPIVKSQFAVSSKAAAEAKKRASELQNKVGSTNNEILLKTQKNSRAMRTIYTIISKLRIEQTQAQNIISSLERKEAVLSAEEKKSFAEAQRALKKANSAIAAKFQEIQKLVHLNRSLFEQISEADRDLLQALTMNQHHAAVFTHKAITSEQELARLYKEMNHVCK